MADARLWHPSQMLAPERLALGLIESSRRGKRQSKGEMGHRRGPKSRLESRFRVAYRLTGPRLGALDSPFLGVDQGKKPKADHITVRNLRCPRALDGLECNAAGPAQIAGKEQRLGQARSYG